MIHANPLHLLDPVCFSSEISLPVARYIHYTSGQPANRASWTPNFSRHCPVVKLIVTHQCSVQSAPHWEATYITVLKGGMECCQIIVEKQKSVYCCRGLPVTVVLYMVVRSLFIQSKKACNVFRIPWSLPFRTLLAQRSYTSFTEVDWLEENYLLVML